MFFGSHRCDKIHTSNYCNYYHRSEIARFSIYFTSYIGSYSTKPNFSMFDIWFETYIYIFFQTVSSIKIFYINIFFNCHLYRLKNLKKMSYFDFFSYFPTPSTTCISSSVSPYNLYTISSICLSNSLVSGQGVECLGQGVGCLGQGVGCLGQGVMTPCSGGIFFLSKI